MKCVWGKKIEYGGRLAALRSLFTLKSVLQLSISNQMIPLLSLYEHPFPNNHMCPQGIIYNASPRALGGFVDTGVFVI
jgi:hypothetical protein